MSSRGWRGFAAAVLVVVTAVAALAQAGTPQAFLDGIYKPYLSRDFKGMELSSEADIRRYFAPPLADAIVRDFAAARKANEVPMLDGDPFIDAQDWEVANLKIAVKTAGTTAVATVAFVIFGKPRTVTLDLVATSAGWRIAEIRSPSGSLRDLYKLR